MITADSVGSEVASLSSIPGRIGNTTDRRVLLITKVFAILKGSKIVTKSSANVHCSDFKSKYLLLTLVTSASDGIAVTGHQSFIN